MPFTDSRLGPGLLLLGTAPGVEYGFQVSNLRLVPSVDSTDGTPTLAVPDPAPETKTTYALEGSAINDFATAAGLQMYCYDQDGDLVDFSWTSNTAAGEGATCVGKCIVRAFEIGGNVGEQLVTDFSWPCEGKPTFTPAAGGLSAQSAKAGKS